MPSSSSRPVRKSPSRSGSKPGTSAERLRPPPRSPRPGPVRRRPEQQVADHAADQVGRHPLGDPRSRSIAGSESTSSGSRPGRFRLSRALAAFLPCSRSDSGRTSGSGRTCGTTTGWATIGVVAGVAAVVIALVAYLILKRPGGQVLPGALHDHERRRRQPVCGPHGLADVRPQPGADPLPRCARRSSRPSRSAGGSRAATCSSTRPILVGNQLFGINNNGLAFAVKASTGKARWKQQIAHLNASAPDLQRRHHLRLESRAGPGRRPGAAHDGHSLWKHPLPGRTESSPLVVGNKVIVGCECNTVFALDKKTGKTIWERHVNGAVKAAPAYSDGIVYVGDYSGEMSAIRVNDGSIKWQAGSQGSSFGRSGRFYADADGRLRPRLRRQRRRAHVQLRPADRAALPGATRPATTSTPRAVAARTAGHPAHRLLRLLRRRLLRARRPHRRASAGASRTSARSRGRRA